MGQYCGSLRASVLAGRVWEDICCGCPYSRHSCRQLQAHPMTHIQFAEADLGQARDLQQVVCQPCSRGRRT